VVVVAAAVVDAARQIAPCRTFQWRSRLQVTYPRIRAARVVMATGPVAAAAVVDAAAPARMPVRT